MSEETEYPRDFTEPGQILRIEQVVEAADVPAEACGLPTMPATGQ
jgi:hypothetical protein